MTTKLSKTQHEVLTLSTPIYSIGTWDTDEQAFTPQAGLNVASINITIFQLRKAMRELRKRWYSCHRFRGEDGDSDPSVLIERTDGAPEAEILKGWKR